MPWLNRKLLVHYHSVVCMFFNEVRNIYRYFVVVFNKNVFHSRLLDLR